MPKATRSKTGATATPNMTMSAREAVEPYARIKQVAENNGKDFTKVSEDEVWMPCLIINITKRKLLTIAI